MDTAMKFRVILDHEIKKLCLHRIPRTVQELEAAIKLTFGISGDISIQYKDPDFNDFFTLSSPDDLKDKDTLKIVYVPPAIFFTNVDLPEHSTADCSVPKSVPEDDLVSQPSTSNDSTTAESDDTVELSPRTAGMHKPWPSEFPVPKFSYNTEVALQKGHENYLRDGSLLCNEAFYPSVKANILKCLAELMYSYIPYPNDAQRHAVAEALIKQHQCLKEPGSFSGLYGWQQSLKYKVGNYRSKLRRHGIPELLVNSLKHKSSEDKKPAKNVKKARKAEVNSLPPHPAGETEDSFESVRLELISETKKKNNRVINELMSRTFSFRRQEIVGQASSVEYLLERWPALFEQSQINEEFRRINGESLESTFMSQLDKRTPKMLSLFNAKGGAVGQRMKSQILELIQRTHLPLSRKRREVVLRCLIEYMGERQEELISDHHSRDETEVQAKLSECPMKIYVCHQPDGIIIEGHAVVRGLTNLSQACCLLFGLTYALELKYPPKLGHTFETYQRLFVGIDPMRPKPSSKYTNLLNKLS